MSRSSTYVAAPFDGVTGAKPATPTPRASKPPTLRAPVAAIVAREAPKAAHVPPKAEPWQKIDTTLAPESIAHAVSMREALKHRVAHLQQRVKGEKGRLREETVRLIQAAQKRSSELGDWIRSENGAQSNKRNNTDLIRALLDIIDRLEDEGAHVTDEERDVMDEAAEFVVWVREQVRIRNEMKRGLIPKPMEMGEL